MYAVKNVTRRVDNGARKNWSVIQFSVGNTWAVVSYHASRADAYVALSVVEA